MYICFLRCPFVSIWRHVFLCLKITAYFLYSVVKPYVVCVCVCWRGKGGSEEEEDEDTVDGGNSAIARRATAKKAIKAEAEYESDVSFSFLVLFPPAFGLSVFFIKTRSFCWHGRSLACMKAFVWIFQSFWRWYWTAVDAFSIWGRTCTQALRARYNISRCDFLCCYGTPSPVSCLTFCAGRRRGARNAQVRQTKGASLVWRHGWGRKGNLEGKIITRTAVKTFVFGACDGRRVKRKEGILVEADFLWLRQNCRRS